MAAACGPGQTPCSYRDGFTVNVKSHVPPAPFGGRDYGSGPRAAVSQHDLRSLKPTELVMANPPLETADPPSPHIQTLSVDCELAVIDGRGAQVVLYTIKPMDLTGDGFQAVAKIYDPLYYSFSHKDVPSVPYDVTRFADEDYSREATAYEHLQAVGQARHFTPKYFGSYTFTANLQIGKKTPPQSRPVHLILIEYVPGKSIRDLYTGPAPVAATFDEVYRLEVLARIIDGKAKLRFKGLDQQDLAAPNPSSIPRVVLIDYSISVIYVKTMRKIGPYNGTTLPPNPMRIHWNNSLQEFSGWIPAMWETSPRPRQEWLKKRFGGKNLSRYAPIKKELEFSEY
ncbi:uncharacterized protein C8A04DRAFT_40780 [Dichotomopilus funicola]|uniref:Uncharacterized protein n=1 Tax=Dichotomopilus funicola TaxID=1934379 RepID=A0AAN6UUC9_9PEZI|nr:hypothetical protein C8A04DRAFT_40780 [Dichotomopilus funicola]